MIVIMSKMKAASDEYKLNPYKYDIVDKPDQENLKEPPKIEVGQVDKENPDDSQMQKLVTPRSEAITEANPYSAMPMNQQMMQM